MRLAQSVHLVALLEPLGLGFAHEGNIVATLKMEFEEKYRRERAGEATFDIQPGNRMVFQGKFDLLLVELAKIGKSGWLASSSRSAGGSSSRRVTASLIWRGFSFQSFMTRRGRLPPAFVGTGEMESIG